MDLLIIGSLHFFHYPLLGIVILGLLHTLVKCSGVGVCISGVGGDWLHIAGGNQLSLVLGIEWRSVGLSCRIVVGMHCGLVDGC